MSTLSLAVLACWGLIARRRAGEQGSEINGVIIRLFFSAQIWPSICLLLLLVLNLIHDDQRAAARSVLQVFPTPNREARFLVHIRTRRIRYDKLTRIAITAMLILTIR